MRVARDTFLHFIYDNANGQFEVHPIRTDPNDPAASVFKMNAVNIHFLNLALGVDTHTQHVSIDVVYDDESSAVEATTALWNILSASFSCPLLDYTDTSNPVTTGTGNIFWDRRSVKFRYVRSDFYHHSTCSLKLIFHTS